RKERILATAQSLLQIWSIAESLGSAELTSRLMKCQWAVPDGGLGKTCWHAWLITKPGCRSCVRTSSAQVAKSRNRRLPTRDLIAVLAFALFLRRPSATTATARCPSLPQHHTGPVARNKHTHTATNLLQKLFQLAILNTSIYVSFDRVEWYPRT